MNWLNGIELYYQSTSEAMGWSASAVVRLALAAVLGGMIGIEREHNGHEAGFRTYALVCLGSALAMVVSIGLARFDWWADFAGGESIRVDPGRIAYGVMGGVGFLGAGSIVQSRGHIRGLTTAAGIWCAAAVGLSVGLGQLVPPVAGTLLVMLFLFLLDPISQWLPRERVAVVTLRITGFRDGGMQTLRESGKAQGMTIRHIDIESTDRSADTMVVTALVDTRHADLVDRVMQIVKDQPQWELQKLNWMAD